MDTFLILLTVVSFPEKSRHPYPPPPTTGTREALMELPQALERALALLERRIAVTRVRVCDGNAMNVR